MVAHMLSQTTNTYSTKLVTHLTQSWLRTAALRFDKGKLYGSGTPGICHWRTFTRTLLQFTSCLLLRGPSPPYRCHLFWPASGSYCSVSSVATFLALKFSTSYLHVSSQRIVANVVVEQWGCRWTRKVFVIVVAPLRFLLDLGFCSSPTRVYHCTPPWRTDLLGCAARLHAVTAVWPTSKCVIGAVQGDRFPKTLYLRTGGQS